MTSLTAEVSALPSGNEAVCLHDLTHMTSLTAEVSALPSGNEAVRLHDFAAKQRRQEFVVDGHLKDGNQQPTTFLEEQQNALQ